MDQVSDAAHMTEVSFLEHALGTPFLLGLCVIGVALLLHFFIQYLLRAFALRAQLMNWVGAVSELRSTPPRDLKSILEGIFATPRIQAQWKEYEETLHEQYTSAGVEREIETVRATVPAQNFINTETVVDPWIGSEYFKHLPGILTGLGIIGTFFGLISGLQQFNPANIGSNPGELGGLDTLFREVKFAFTFSGIAIVSAIAITAVEKWLYASCVKWTGQLTVALDGLFRSGVGEEYLRDLAESTKENASQTRQLKESLVDDLKVVLTNLSDRQVSAIQSMSQDIGREIQNSLERPLQQMAETIKIASNRELQSSGAVLENLMTAFIAQMKAQVGGQMGELSALLGQTANSMTQVETTLRTLVDDMRSAVSEQSATSARATEELLRNLGEHQIQQEMAVAASTKVVMDKLQQSISQMAAAHEAANERTRESVTNTIDAMKAQVDNLASSNREVTQSALAVTTRIQEGTESAVQKLASAASAVEAAVLSVGSATAGLGEVAERVGDLGKQTIEASRTSATASRDLAAAAQTLRATTAQLEVATTKLEAVSSEASRESSARSDLIRDLQRVAELTKMASGQFAELTNEVKNSLVENLETFGTGVAEAVARNLIEYEKQLGNAVKILKSALESLHEFAEKD